MKEQKVPNIYSMTIQDDEILAIRILGYKETMEILKNYLAQRRDYINQCIYDGGEEAEFLAQLEIISQEEITAAYSEIQRPSNQDFEDKNYDGIIEWMMKTRDNQSIELQDNNPSLS